ncbi:MAG: hypothetical protein ACD_12C00092G0001 [uncultured bacterium]|nr:MAG: hypothetical protein ACD_12C00092G0001 [uncultured bacterium]
MPQISKRDLPKDKLNKAFDLFFDLIVNINNKNQAETLLQELLTPTEKIMIAKRIACFYLFTKDVPSSQIGQLIKLSQSTICHFKYLFNNSHEIKKFFSKRINDEQIKLFLKDILVDFIGSTRKGSDWSFNKKIYYQHQRERKQPL